MTTKKWRAVLDEVGDQISSSVYDSIRNIDRNEARIESLMAIEAQMQSAADNATFQLVTQLPTAANAKADVYYIVLNSTTGKYEEYKKDGSTMAKVGLIGDAVYPTLLTGPVYALMAKDQENYDVYVPVDRNWYELVDDEYVQSADTATWVWAYTEVDKTGAGYSESDPATLGWFVYDNGEYAPASENAVDGEKTYFTRAHSYPKDYYSISSIYAEILASSTGYADMNPKHLDWYERSELTFVPTTDTSVVQDKKYFLYILNS